MRKECLCLPRLVLGPSELILLITLLESKSLHETLDTLDIGDMQIYFLLKDDQIFIHFYFEIMSAGFDFGFELKHLFLLIIQ